jgi:hypothetical protein
MGIHVLQTYLVFLEKGKHEFDYVLIRILNKEESYQWEKAVLNVK